MTEQISSKEDHEYWYPNHSDFTPEQLVELNKQVELILKTAYEKNSDEEIPHYNWDFEDIMARAQEIAEQGRTEAAEVFGRALAAVRFLNELPSYEDDEEYHHMFEEDIETCTTYCMALAAALHTWGKSPYVDGSKGTDGKGTHAGVEHFFAYRLDPQKAYRWSRGGLNIQPTFEDFVEVSGDLYKAGNTPLESEDVEVCYDLVDDAGNIRRTGNFRGDFQFISYKPSSSGEFKTISIFGFNKSPHKSMEQFFGPRMDREVEKITSESEANKINKLQGRPHLVRIK